MTKSINLSASWLECAGPHTRNSDQVPEITIAHYESKTDGPTSFEGHTTFATPHGPTLTGAVNGHFPDNNERSFVLTVQYDQSVIDYQGVLSENGREITGHYSSNGGEGAFIWRRKHAALEA